MECPKPQIEYRFVPRTLREELENPAKVSDIFTKMFNDPTPFVAGAIGRDLKSDTINGRFVSQA
jgi:hypothetical protein